MPALTVIAITFKVIDIRYLDADVFLHADNPGEIILAILANYKNNQPELIINKNYINCDSDECVINTIVKY